jgi:preprotein translocase subunit SecF
MYVVNSVLVAGAVGSFLSFFVLHKILNKFPTLAPYHLLIQIVSAALLIAGIYFKGGYSVEMEWREKVAAIQAELEEAKKKSEQVNTVVETKVVTKTKVIKEKADTIVQYVDRPVMQEFDKTCPIPKEAIDVHNEAARMNKAIEEMRKGAVK